MGMKERFDQSEIGALPVRRKFLGRTIQKITTNVCMESLLADLFKLLTESRGHVVMMGSF
jgi:hypothetical protein